MEWITRILNKVFKEKKTKDTNIEWYGPDVYLKEKEYDVDKHFESLTDNEKYKSAEKKRIENVRNNTGDSSSNEIDGTRFSDNNSKDANKGT